MVNNERRIMRCIIIHYFFLSPAVGRLGHPAPHIAQE